MRIRIEDNGIGTAHLVKGFGLQAMTDRMANLGGVVEVESVRGAGTIVVCSVPAMNGAQALEREGA